MKKGLLLTILAAAGSLVHAQDPTLLRDINTTSVTYGNTNNDPNNFCAINGITYYMGYGLNTGRTVWRTDGTLTGTRPLFYNSGLNFQTFSNTEIRSGLMTMGGDLYFFSANKSLVYNSDTYNLVKSDVAGNITILARSSSQPALTTIMNTESSNRGEGSPARMASLNGTLYFPFADSANGTELWKSDGTAAGTMMVKDLLPGRSGYVLNNFTAANGYVFFSAINGISYSVWRTDGTAAGTIQLVDGTLSANNSVKCFTAQNNKLYFVALNITNNTLTIYQTDGSVAGTIAIEQASTASTVAFNRTVVMKQGANNIIYTLGAGMVKWDGTAKTVLTTSNLSIRQNAWADVNGTVFYGTNNTVSTLWKTDGTPAGTVMVKDSLSSQNFLNVNGTLFFAGNENLNGSTYGVELWKSDGTKNGTVRLSDFNTDITSMNGDGIVDVTNTYTMTVQSGKVLFSAFNGITTPQGGSTLLASSDGTVAGTGILPLPAVNGGSFPAARYVWNNALYFAAYDNVRGSELWKTDGTPGGTALLKDVNAGLQSSYLQAFTPFNGELYFLTTDSANNYFRNALWKTDGTAAGTVKVKDSLGHVNYALNKMMDLNGRLVLIAGGSVYVSDGTALGTSNIPITAPAVVQESKAANFTVLNGKMIIIAEAGPNTNGASELWLVDPVLSAATRYYTGAMAFPEMQTFDNKVYFIRERVTGNYNYVLWKTDGTVSGTSVADTITYPKQLTVTNNGTALYYTGTAAGNKSFIRKIAAGTAAVTMKQWTDTRTYDYVYDNAYTYYSNPSVYYANAYIQHYYPDQYPYFAQCTAAGPVLFAGGDNSTGIELMQTDGTAGGTSVLKDVMSGVGDSNPQYFTHARNNAGDSILLFVANGGSGNELWLTNATATGTRNYIQTVAASSTLNPQYPTLVNNKLVFWGTSLDKGTEPYAYDMNQVLRISGTAAAQPGLMLYPNPAQDAVNVKAAPGAVITVYSLTGAKMYEGVAKAEVTVIPVAQLPAGMYTVTTVDADGKRQSGKFARY